MAWVAAAAVEVAAASCPWKLAVAASLPVVAYHWAMLVVAAFPWTLVAVALQGPEFAVVVAASVQEVAVAAPKEVVGLGPWHLLRQKAGQHCFQQDSEWWQDSPFLLHWE